MGPLWNMVCLFLITLNTPRPHSQPSYSKAFFSRQDWEHEFTPYPFRECWEQLPLQWKQPRSSTNESSSKPWLLSYYRILLSSTDLQALDTTWVNVEGTILCGQTTTAKACVCTFICIMPLTWKLLEKEKQLVAAEEGEEGVSGHVMGSAESGVEMSSYQYRHVTPTCGHAIGHSRLDTLSQYWAVCHNTCVDMGAT